jgi:poly-gamma-glutamate capsule biosynthesis protein CapA/YwtB (metallophosphatase superfamily)
MSSSMLMGFVGDLLVHRDHPQEAFREVRDVLKAPQIMFANLEGMYADNPHPAPNALVVVGAPAHNLDVFAKVGFNVLSMASNHILDMGYEAMLETRARLRAQGVKTCGAGDCAADAREPAIVETDGMRVAFLAYASYFPIGYEARSNVPGLAPVRAYNFWRDSEPTSYPGGAPLITTIPDQSDIANLAEDIRRARERADLVVASFHWGEYSRPFHLTEHETRTARYCIDQGADMVVGHHHHALRGMEWYKGRPIMYGLGHFVYDLRLELSEEVKKMLLESAEDDTSYRAGPREGWPLLPLHKDTRMTVMAWAEANRHGIADIGFLPCRLTPDGLVHPLRLNSTESNEVVAYLDKCNRTQHLKSVITAEGSQPIAGFQTLRVIPA